MARHGMNEAIARLSTGKRAMYGGDAAGQAMANEIKSKGLSYGIAARNAEDGISVAQTIESALMEIANLAVRLRELAIQADNATFQSTTDVAALDAEAAAITKTIEAISTETKFNGVAVLSASDQNFTIGVTDACDLTTITSKGIADPSATTAAAAASSHGSRRASPVGGLHPFCRWGFPPQPPGPPRRGPQDTKKEPQGNCKRPPRGGALAKQPGPSGMRVSY